MLMCTLEKVYCSRVLIGLFLIPSKTIRFASFDMHMLGCVIWQWPDGSAPPYFSVIFIAVMSSPCIFWQLSCSMWHATCKP